MVFIVFLKVAGSICFLYDMKRDTDDLYFILKCRDIILIERSAIIVGMGTADY